MDDLPTDYDAIVVGTGIIESVVAAAISRIGKSVLHLDENDYYGDNWASFNLDGFENWIKSCNENNVEKNSYDCLSNLINENERMVEIKPNSNVRNARLNHFVKNVCTEECDIMKEESNDEIEKAVESVIKSKCSLENKDSLLALSRRFNLDLCPKLLFSRGMLVELLITSNIARYAEFKSVSQVLTWRNGQLEPVPCSRADVFATKNVTVVHKRMLVKVLTLFAAYTENLDEFKGFEHKTFLEYLKHKKLPENLIHYILYAIAMGDNTTSCLDGVKKCKHFLESLGRYGNTPFIFPMYGSGELPQCFCRLCAVFGGIYCLQRGVEALIVNEDKCLGVISKGKRLNAKTVVLSSKYIPQEFLSNENPEAISRAIFITDRSLLKSDRETLTLLQFPPISQVSDKSVTVVELSSGTCTCPDNYFVVHMTAKSTLEAATDFHHVVECLFERDSQKKGSKPRILWSGTWNIFRRTARINDLGLKNIKICCSVDSDLDYDISVNEAKNIFKDIYPEEEFLPRAPDPDEIVLDAEEAPSESAFVENEPSELRDTTGVTSRVAKEEEGGPNDVADEKHSQPDDAAEQEHNDLAEETEKNLSIKNATAESVIASDS